MIRRLREQHVWFHALSVHINMPATD
jgi:hypothetical protein